MVIAILYSCALIQNSRIAELSTWQCVKYGIYSKIQETFEDRFAIRVICNDEALENLLKISCTQIKVALQCMNHFLMIRHFYDKATVPQCSMICKKWASVYMHW